MSLKIAVLQTAWYRQEMEQWGRTSFSVIHEELACAIAGSGYSNGPTACYVTPHHKEKAATWKVSGSLEICMAFNGEMEEQLIAGEASTHA